MMSISGAKTPIIIAEIGGKYADLRLMKNMVAAAREAGADMVKFQTYRAETIAIPGSFFTMEDGSRLSQYDFFKSTELSEDDHVELDRHCRSLSIPWISTPSHPSDVDFLERFDCPAYKTGSDDLTNLPFLKYIASKGRPMIVSTGMCTMGEVERAVNGIRSTGHRDLTLLHCVVSYPAKAEDANLRTIQTLRQAFGCPVGLSDHTTDELTSVLAIAFGAVVIEKHLTLDHALKLPDHESSLDPPAFTVLVQRIRTAWAALGDGIKRIQPTEEKWRQAARKSLIAACDVEAGVTLCAENIAVRRPGSGIAPHYLESLVGRQVGRAIPAGTMLTWDMIQSK